MNKKTVILLIIGFTAVSIGIACFLQFKDRTKELEVTVDPIALKINTITSNNLDGYLKNIKLPMYILVGQIVQIVMNLIQTSLNQLISIKFMTNLFM